MTTPNAKKVLVAARTLQAPFGEIRLYATRDALVGVSFPGQAPPTSVTLARIDEVEIEAGPVLDHACNELGEYFAGARRGFTIPLAPLGTTFQLAPWEALRRIPFGETRSYGWQARSLGKPLAARAVGGANGQNPISIIVPCHRVIGADGSLTGFGGGLDTKRWLLDHEHRVLAADPR